MKNHTWFQKIRSTKGALLIEVLLSLLIFTIGIVSSFSLLMHSSNVNSMSKNRIIAVNLAREGLEVVKNIRDTNWLIYSSDIRKCWNFSPDLNETGSIEPTDTCAPNEDDQNNHAIGVDKNGNRIRTVIVDFDSTNSRWMILPAAKRLDESVSPQVFTNYDTLNFNGEVKTGTDVENINPTNYSDIPNQERNVELGITANGRYTHHNADWEETSPFYRVIDICYLDNVTADCTGTDGLFPVGQKSLDNRIKITARVYWKEKTGDNEFRSVVIETILTDYLDRSEWTS